MSCSLGLSSAMLFNALGNLSTRFIYFPTSCYNPVGKPREPSRMTCVIGVLFCLIFDIAPANGNANVDKG